MIQTCNRRGNLESSKQYFPHGIPRFSHNVFEPFGIELGTEGGAQGVFEEAGDARRFGLARACDDHLVAVAGEHGAERDSDCLFACRAPTFQLGPGVAGPGEGVGFEGEGTAAADDLLPKPFDNAEIVQEIELNVVSA